MDEDNYKYVRFDWAIKHTLRDKENFGVLEGLITVLTGEEVKIQEILESESNVSREDQKFNRVDIKAKNSKGELIIVEVQLTRQLYYLQRVLFGVARAVSEHMTSGGEYSNVKKVYSISILYCDLGKADDYVYHGRTVFKGIHTGSDLVVTTKQLGAIARVLPEEIFPEYYFIMVNEFDKIPANPLDEWMDYLKTGRIKEDTRTPGLQEARKKLLYLKMSDKERRAYENHLDSIVTQDDVLETAKLEGREEGMAIGMEKGLVQGMQEGMEKGLVQGMQEGMEKGSYERAVMIARNMLEEGMDKNVVARISGLSVAEIEEL